MAFIHVKTVTLKMTEQLGNAHLMSQLACRIFVAKNHQAFLQTAGNAYYPMASVPLISNNQ